MHEDKSFYTLIPYKSFCKKQLLKYLFAAGEQRMVLYKNDQLLEWTIKDNQP